MRPIYVSSRKFPGVPNYAHGYFFPEFLVGFVSIDPINVRTKFEVCIALPVPGIIGGTQKMGRPWIPHTPCKIFNEFLFGRPCECCRQF